MSALTLLDSLPYWYQLLVVGVLGAVMASFINVVAYRLHTNASLSGRSRCFSCGHQLSWYELVPFVSFLSLRGRCRVCQARIPLRDFIVELLGALLYIVVYVTFVDPITLFFSWVLVSVLLAISLYDLAHFIIPNELVLIVAAVGVAAYSYQNWPLALTDFSNGLLLVLVAAGFYAVLWKYSAGRWLGFGDVKLAAALALFLTLEEAFSMVVLSFWIGAVVGLLLVFLPVLLQRHVPTHRSLHMRSEIPFAPFIVAAFLVVYIYELSVFAFFVPWF